MYVFFNIVILAVAAAGLILVSDIISRLHHEVIAMPLTLLVEGLLVAAFFAAPEYVSWIWDVKVWVIGVVIANTWYVCRDWHTNAASRSQIDPPRYY